MLFTKLSIFAVISNCTGVNCGPINTICSTSLGGQLITEHAINKMEMCMDSFCGLGFVTGFAESTPINFFCHQSHTIIAF
jgi:hypothetical protein